MVRIHLYEQCKDGYKIPLFQTVLVGFSEFVRLLKAGKVLRLGKQYVMFE